MVKRISPNRAKRRKVRAAQSLKATRAAKRKVEPTAPMAQINQCTAQNIEALNAEVSRVYGDWGGCRYGDTVTIRRPARFVPA